MMIDQTALLTHTFIMERGNIAKHRRRRAEAMAKAAELGQKNKQIKIEYKKIRDQNYIKRREERNKIIGR